MKDIVTMDKYYNPLYEGDYVLTERGRICKIVWLHSNSHIGYDLKPVANLIYPPPSTYNAWNPQGLVKLFIKDEAELKDVDYIGNLMETEGFN